MHRVKIKYNIYTGRILFNSNVIKLIAVEIKRSVLSCTNKICSRFPF
jgi:hypothetical protein